MRMRASRVREDGALNLLMAVTASTCQHGPSVQSIASHSVPNSRFRSVSRLAGI
jgi:hypothetical protein